MSKFSDINETMFLEAIYTQSRNSYQSSIDELERNIKRNKQILERDIENLANSITKRDILNAEIEKLKGQETNDDI